MKKTFYIGYILIYFFSAFFTGILIPDDGMANPWVNSINVESEAGSLRVCLTPDASMRDRFIIRPRCDNINLILKCGDTRNPWRIKERMIPGRAIGIVCPSDPPCSPGDDFCDKHVDVIHIPNNVASIGSLCITCPIPEMFDLSPKELGIQGNPAGKARNCFVYGEFQTGNVSDPLPAIQGFSPSQTWDWCRNNHGKIDLLPFKTRINQKRIHFEYDNAGTPLMKSGSSSQMLTFHRTGSYSGPKPKLFTPILGRDDDGYTDTTEQIGFPLTSNMAFAASTYPAHSETGVPSCTPTLPDPNRQWCVHQDSKEVFAILHPANSNSSYFPSMSSTTDLKGFFSQISAPADTEHGGLGIVVHPLEQDPIPADWTRLVADSQTAIRITEDLDTLDLPIDKKTTIILGTATVGTPNDGGYNTIYTKRIKQYVCDLCGGEPDGSGNCQDGQNFHNIDRCVSATPVSATGDTLVREYAKYVNQHEFGHSLNLVVTGDYDENYHHTPGDATHMMTPSAIYSKRGQTVTFYLPYYFCQECRENKDLTD